MPVTGTKQGTTYADMSMDERISKEYKRLIAIYKNIPKDQKTLVDGLIYQAAFMRVTLDDYQKDLIQNGYVDGFQQSKDLDPYERVRPVAQLYNTMVKNYQGVIKQLNDLLPVEDAGEDPLTIFVRNKK